MAPQNAVTTTELNLRQSASDQAAILVAIPPGAQMEVLGNHGVWLYVRYADQQGFAHSSFAEPLPPIGDETKWTTTINAEQLNVRQAPDPNAPVVGAFAQGEQAPVLGFQSHWLLTLYQGQVGFINGGYTLSVSESSGPPVVAAPDPAVTVSQSVARAFAASDGSVRAGQMTPEEIRAAREAIRQEPDERVRGDKFEALQAGVIYANQRDNLAVLGGQKIETPSGAMCNLTSLAMCLSYLGIANPNPAVQYEDALEQIRQQHGLRERTNIQGWGGVAEALNARVRVLGEKVTQGHDWYEANVRPVLRQGSAVMLSIGGHIARVQAVTAEGLIADDPWGHSKLYPGEQGAFKFPRPNAYAAENQTNGDDVLWPWGDVERHTMRWIAAVSPAPAVLGPSDPLPDIEDDGVVAQSEG